MSGEFLKEVKNQYENYPYPRRDPEDERKRIARTSLDSLDMVNYYCFEGKKDFTKGFRALIAGGGTGDSVIFMAEQLREVDCEIVYIDLSQASMEIAKKRAEIRGLEKKIRFINDSLLNLPKLNLGEFDYVNCTGVLHHLASPEDGLKTLKKMVKKDGALAIMVYGKYGRTGLYEIQDLMRIINKDITETQHKVDLARKMLQNLPTTNWFRKNFNSFRADVEFCGDIGIYDLCLHTQDRCYTVPELYEWIEKCGLKFVSFLEVNGLHKMWYNPLSYTKDADLIAQFEKLSERDKHAAGEIINGELKKHTFYLSPVTRTLPSPENLDNVPAFSSVVLMENMYSSIYDFFQEDKGQSLQMDHINVRLAFERRAFTPYIFKYMDGNRTTGEIINLIKSDNDFAGQPVNEKEIFEEFLRIYNAFNKFDWMILRHKTGRNIVKTMQEMQNYFMGMAA